MNKRSMTAFLFALAFLAVAGRVAHAQNQLPPGWVENWDGSGTYVYLGSPGTGNVGRTPGSFDIPQAVYSARHPGWYDELVGQITDEWYRHNQGGGGGWEDQLSPDDDRRIRPGVRLDIRLRQRVRWVPDALAGRYHPAPRGYRYGVLGGHVLLLGRDYQVREVYRVHRDQRDQRDQRDHRDQ
jgi:hypothetical protein